MSNDDRKKPKTRPMGELMREDEDKVLARVKAELREEQAAWEKVKDLLQRIKGKQ